MTKYHINKNTGKVAACNARKGDCPITKNAGDRHFATRQEAQKHYEKTNQDDGKYLASSRKTVINEFSRDDREILDSIESALHPLNARGAEFNVGNVYYTTSNDVDDSGNRILAVGGVAGIVDDARILIKKDAKNGALSACLYINGVDYKIDGTYVEQYNSSDEKFAEDAAKIAFRAPDLAAKSFRDVFSPSKKLLENLREVEAYEGAREVDFSDNYGLKIPGYTDKLEVSESSDGFVEYVGDLPSGKQITIRQEGSIIVKALINDRSEIAIQNNKLENATQRKAFIALVMTELDAVPQLTSKYYHYDDHKGYDEEEELMKFLHFMDHYNDDSDEREEDLDEYKRGYYA